MRGGRGGYHFYYYFTVEFSHIYCVCRETKVSLYYFSDLQSFELVSYARFLSTFSFKSYLMYEDKKVEN